MAGESFLAESFAAGAFGGDPITVAGNDALPQLHVFDDGLAAPLPVLDGLQDNDPGSGFLQGGQSLVMATSPLGGQIKRALDLVVAGSTIIACAPLMLLITVLIRIQGRGPVIFAHKRVGFRGRPFYCYKFRTMRPDADKALETYLAQDPQAAAEWQANRKLRRDPRVTFLGRMLRSSSLDELPQLFNVMRGEMSCVGPRPVVAEELQRYGASAATYLSVRPGVTGLWQVSGRTEISYEQRVQMDCHYVQHWSIGYDVLILARTALAVLRVDRAC